MPTEERRQAARATANVLAALRCVENDVVTWTGFARTLNLSVTGALLELPDKMSVGRELSMEFLLDNDEIGKMNAVVTRVDKVKKMYHVAVEFVKLPAKTKRLLARQTKST